MVETTATHDDAWFPKTTADESRTEKALTEEMTVLAEVEDGKATGEYTVKSESGSTYTVDLQEQSCTCPDHQIRGSKCKHKRRVALHITHTDLIKPGEEAGAQDEEVAEALSEK